VPTLIDGETKGNSQSIESRNEGKQRGDGVLTEEEKPICQEYCNSRRKKRRNINKKKKKKRSKEDPRSARSLEGSLRVRGRAREKVSQDEEGSHLRGCKRIEVAMDEGRHNRRGCRGNGENRGGVKKEEDGLLFIRKTKGIQFAEMRSDWTVSQRTKS